MNYKLFLHATFKMFIGFILIGCLLFIPAGTINYFNGWLFMILLFIPMFILGLYLYIKNPELLKRRLNAKEKENNQKAVVLISGLMFVLGFITAGLNYKYSWFILPNIVLIVSCILFLISYFMYAIVLKKNTYLLRTIEVLDDQKVIDTGLYGIVRHPMYLATIIMFLTIPLILGSIYSFIIFLIYPIVIVIRIKNEEKILEKELNDYREYKNKVKYRLIPFVW